MKLEQFRLERWMTRWELDVDYDIAESGILPLSIAELCTLIGEPHAAELRSELDGMLLGYSEARGSLALRTELANSYTRATPDDVLVTTGAIEANFLLINALVGRGDHVIAVAPSYQQLQSVPRSTNAEVSLWHLDPKDGFQWDLDKLASLVQSNTRLIIINSPHNPTGAMLSADQMLEVVRIAERANAWVLSDEAYRWLDHPGSATMPPPLHNVSERAISVGTLSKPFGLPGLRIGWSVSNSEIVAKCWSLRDYVSLSPAKMSDAIAVQVIRHRDRILPRNAAIIAENLETARTWFTENADLATWTEPRAGLLAMMKYTLPVDSMTLANDLARECRVMLAPGSTFDLEGYLRIGIGQRPDLFREGLSRTAEYLRSRA